MNDFKQEMYVDYTSMFVHIWNISGTHLLPALMGLSDALDQFFSWKQQKKLGKAQIHTHKNLLTDIIEFLR